MERTPSICSLCNQANSGERKKEKHHNRLIYPVLICQPFTALRVYANLIRTLLPACRAHPSLISAFTSRHIQRADEARVFLFIFGTSEHTQLLLSALVLRHRQQQRQQQKHANAQSPRAGSRHVGSARNRTRRACTAVSTKDSGGSGSTRSDRIAAISSHGASDCHRGQEQVWTTLQLNSSFKKKKRKKRLEQFCRRRWTMRVGRPRLTPCP